MRRRAAWRERLAAAGVLAAAPIVLVRLLPPLPALPSEPRQILRYLSQPLAATGLPWLIAAAAWGLWATMLVAVLVGGWRRLRRRRWPRLRIPGIVQAVSAALLGTVAASATGPTVAVAVHTTLVSGTEPLRLDATASDASDAVATATRPEASQAFASASVTTDVPRPAGTSHVRVSTVEEHPFVLVSAATADQRAPVTQPPVYQVTRGDWLGGIAARFLGDFNRYPEIQDLNPNLITNADLIQPAWHLVLPADARDRGPRRHATGQLVHRPTAPDPTSAAPASGTSGPAHPAPDRPPAATGAPSTAPTPRASTVTGASATTRPGTTASPTASAASRSAPFAAGSAEPPHRTDPASHAAHQPGRGVDLPGGWIGLPLAAAVVATASTVWLHRRHRDVPTPITADTADDPDPRPLPPVLPRLRRAVREQAPELLHPAQPQPTVADYVSSDAEHRSDLPPIGPTGTDLAGIGGRIPASGLGLIGPGAEPAARALLVATLSAGGPADPDARGRVVTTTGTLTTLLGGQATQVGATPRLAVTATLAEALTRVEELLIERRRLLDEFEATDLDHLHAAHPFHPPMPPVLLLSHTPPTELRTRLTTTLRLGSPLQISAVLLGDWPGDTLTVQPDGHTAAGNPQRLAVLDAPTTLQMLAVVEEPHTGQPSTDAIGTAETVDGVDLAAPTPHSSIAPSGPDAETPTPPENTAEAAATSPPVGDGARDSGDGNPESSDEMASVASEPAGDDGTVVQRGPGRPRPVLVRLLGPPAIVDGDGTPVPGLRHHARELLVYLAVHRGGADLSDIMEAFWPTATVRRAAERLSTEVGDLRRRIRQAAGNKDIQPVINTGGRYHLDPNLLDIDVWRLADALRRATPTTDPADRITALRDAVQAHTGDLAEGYDYDWIEPPREQLRRQGIRARLHLAEQLAGTQPRAAADLAVAAAGLDALNEDVARQAMRALAALGDAAGIRAQMQRMRAALDEIDEQPSGETVALAAQLLRDITTGRPDQAQPNNSPPCLEPFAAQPTRHVASASS